MATTTWKKKNKSDTGKHTEKLGDEGAPRHAVYNELQKLQGKAPVRALMKKLSEDKPLEVAFSESRPELRLLLTPSGFQLQVDGSLVGFFNQPMFKAPQEGLEGFDVEAIARIVLERAKR
jgi:hypothetical protein